ncbi:sugar transferase [Wukongibacter baidiensis]|uniref:sugar transferase n=1 Tax=Wukongibacter baidiensis TaxID=1723361 RepID=UPI003D7FA7BC
MENSEFINVENYFYEMAVSLDENLRDKYQKQNIHEMLKRILDILLSIIGLVIGIPIIIVFGLAIKLETPGPTIYAQERVGKNGKHFTIYKLRSMYSDAEKKGAKWAAKNDPRITRIGSFIRKTRIDEIPQLINILKGDMSIVGPRPERPHFTIKFNEENPQFINRLVVKPGLTGWAQINGGYEMSPKEKWEADMYYIKNKNILLDILIIFKTIRVVLTGEGAR